MHCRGWQNFSLTSAPGCCRAVRSCCRKCKALCVAPASPEGRSSRGMNTSIEGSPSTRRHPTETWGSQHQRRRGSSQITLSYTAGPAAALQPQEWQPRVAALLWQPHFVLPLCVCLVGSYQVTSPWALRSGFAPQSNPVQPQSPSPLAACPSAPTARSPGGRWETEHSCLLRSASRPCPIHREQEKPLQGEESV